MHLPFLKAGPDNDLRSASVSPLQEAEEDSEGNGEGDAPVMEGGEECERISAKKDGEFFRKLVDPSLPKKEEVKFHYEMGHAVYRNWCPVCVRASGKDMSHKNLEGKTRDRPEYSFDYCFPGDELGYKWTVLVGKERSTRGVGWRRQYL